MKASKTICTTIALGLLSCGLFSQPVAAVPINGDIDFVGTVSFDTTSLATATRAIEFRTDSGMLGGLSVSGTTGAFNSVAVGSFATFTAPYIFNPSTPSSPLWQVGGFTFSLMSSVIINQSASFLSVTGTGTLSGNGYDPTQGVWSFTTSSPNGAMSESFRFATNPSAVPDGGSALALLAPALLGLEALRRKFAAA